MEPFPTSKNRKHQMEISDSEYVMDIFSSTSFLQQTIEINAGIYQSFPVLSGFASQFELYKFKTLEFYFKPLTTDNLANTNTTLGYVALSFLTDPDEINNLNSKQTVMNYQGTLSSKSTQPVYMKIDCHRKAQENYYFVRQGETLNNDTRITDMGILCITVGGQLASSGLLGELYVKYTCAFEKSKIYQSIGNSNLYAHYKCSGTISNTAWFGTVQTPQNGSNLALTFSGFAGPVITVSNVILPPTTFYGNWAIMIVQKGTTAVTNFGTPVWGGTAIALNILENNTTNTTPLISPATTTIATLLQYGTTVTGSSDNNLPVQWSMFNTGSTCMANITAMDVFVWAIPATVRQTD